ncbi:hypothetical protein IV203_023299 [Nitzschia inconspicua]|uniref:Uncharacterized protein n=1 Tax=Nitzschia inconspicua TaxID=303405 RepID=A0A9K3KD00_9STRA|nr:hypothetical protein IV203_023299 [Nitzschia inconspicua]
MTFTCLLLNHLATTYTCLLLDHFIICLSVIAANDPVVFVIYADSANLLDKPGWKRFSSIAKRPKEMFRMANRSKLRSYRTVPKYMYGFKIPRDYEHAIELDKRNDYLTPKQQHCIHLD